MAALKLYRIVHGGIATVVRLSDAELPLYPGAIPVGPAQPTEAPAKARRRVPDKSRTGDAAPATK